MSEETFPYDEWVNDALRSVLSRALKKLAEHGPIGDHHFFINFNTAHEDVVIPGFLRAQYPEEITIVLQHQFDDLMVDEQGFQVSLSFSGKKSQLTVPFDAVTSFADPSVNFGLQIGVNSVSEALKQVQTEHEDVDNLVDDEAEGDSTPFAAAAKIQKIEDAFDNEAISSGDTEIENPDEDDSKTAEVITLDAFRKK